MTVSMLEDEALFGGIEFRLGRSDEGEFRRRGASGHPHEECSVSKVVDSGDEYAGRAMFAWVARQERIWKGESIEISKCLRFVGSVTSGFDNLITI